MDAAQLTVTMSTAPPEANAANRPDPTLADGGHLETPPSDAGRRRTAIAATGAVDAGARHAGRFRGPSIAGLPTQLALFELEVTR